MILYTDVPWWEALDSTERLFWIIAIVSSILFIIQFVLTLIGLDFGGDIELDIDSDSSIELESDFTLFSVRSVVAFFTFFGWIGLIALKNGLSIYTSIASASFSGLLAMLTVGYMMYKFSKFDESGTVSTSDALNKVGDVYLVIPANKSGYGKIHIKIKGALKEMDAVTEHQSPIPYGEKVKVIKILDDNLLLVQKWNTKHI